MLDEMSVDAVSDIVASFRRGKARSSQHRLPDSLGLVAVSLCAASRTPAEHVLHAGRICEVQRRS